MKLNITIEIDDEELKRLFNLKSEEEYPENGIGQEMNVSQYAKVFDDARAGWTKDPEYNLAFLKDQQNYCNDLLKAKGHLFLNEVYDILGIARTKAGAVVGWVYDERNPIGDNVVDFGLMHDYNYDFINGYENTAILDFNVDGNILNYI